MSDCALPNRGGFRYVAGVLVGAYAALATPDLPPLWLVGGLSAVAAAAACRKTTRPISVLMGAAALAWCAAWSAQLQKLSHELVGTDIRATFRIVDWVEERGSQLRLVAKPLTKGNLPQRVRITWYDADAVPQLGDCWRFEVRLRRPRGFANPGGFDHAAWLLRSGVGATGYVRASEGRVACSTHPIVALRQGALERLRGLLPRDQAAAVLEAITVGARHRVSAVQWQQFAGTGTSHLMAISGMHIGLAAGVSFWLLWWLTAALPRGGRGYVCASLGACGAALIYTLLSGFAIPARRALTMLGTTALAVLARRTATAVRVLGIAAIVVFLASPLDVISPGFKLSFAAVALLLWQARRSFPVGGGFMRRCVVGVATLVGMQLVLLAGLMPLTAGLFGRVAWVAPAVNLLVVPIFGFVTVPSALLGLVCAGWLSPLGDPLITLSWHSVRLTLAIIDVGAALPETQVWPALWRPATYLGALLAALWAVLPAGWPARRVGWLSAAAFCFTQAQPTPRGCVDLHMLDVGQGLAVVVATSRKTLVFDTGPAFRSGTDTGRLVVVPFLRWLGRRSVDLVVLSHGDLDHVGGLDSLRESVPVAAVLAGEADPGNGDLPCAAGQVWEWDSIRFAVVHPGAASNLRGNDRSCVLLIQAGRHGLLLTGDIERRAESRLAESTLIGQVAVVTVPHHGSRTSSTAPFVARLSPDLALISSGYSNRWGLPSPEVVARWHEVGADVANTASAGAVSVRLCEAVGIVSVRQQRAAQRRFWQDR